MSITILPVQNSCGVYSYITITRNGKRPRESVESIVEPAVVEELPMEINPVVINPPVEPSQDDEWDRSWMDSPVHVLNPPIMVAHDLETDSDEEEEVLEPIDDLALWLAAGWDAIPAPGSPGHIYCLHIHAVPPRVVPTTEPANFREWLWRYYNRAPGVVMNVHDYIYADESDTEDEMDVVMRTPMPLEPSLDAEIAEGIACMLCEEMYWSNDSNFQFWLCNTCGVSKKWCRSCECKLHSTCPYCRGNL